MSFFRYLTFCILRPISTNPMKIRWLFLLLLFISSFGQAQSYIDVIRASNYYSKAVEAYDNEKFTEALDFLKQSEINMKGKTNNDLVFLKIMTKYKLKDYEASYNLLLQYFNGDFKRNRLFFKNIQPYRQKHDINYDQYLTEQFIDIENKYNLLKGINTKLSPDAIAMRLLTEKKELIPFMRRATNSKNISLSFRRVKENDADKKYWTETIYFDMDVRILRRSVVLTGKRDKTNFMVVCGYDETSNVNKDAFYYTFSHKNCKATKLELGWKDNVGGQQEKGLKELSSKKFNTAKKQVNSVPFTEDEKLYLSQEENMKKLLEVLKKQGY